MHHGNHVLVVSHYPDDVQKDRGCLKASRVEGSPDRLLALPVARETRVPTEGGVINRTTGDYQRGGTKRSLAMAAVEPLPNLCSL